MHDTATELEYYYTFNIKFNLKKPNFQIFFGGGIPQPSTLFLLHILSCSWHTVGTSLPESSVACMTHLFNDMSLTLPQ